MVDGVECLGYVDRHRSGAESWLPFIESLSNARHGGKESSDAGVERAEAMLRGGGRQGGGEGGKDEPFEDLGGRTKEGDWAVRCRQEGIFARFRYRKDGGLFPNGGNL